MNEGKIDIFKRHKAEYKSGKKPVVVVTTKGLYLTIEGSGAPGAKNFQYAVGALYAMAYTMKMGRKKDGQGDYTIGKLEGIYWAIGEADLANTAMESWLWKLMIRTPEVVDGFGISDQDLRTARNRLAEKKKDADCERVKLDRMDEGDCVQMLHVGPYEKEHETLAIMLEFCTSEGLQPHGQHHEIYLSDPRRVEPENLKTILRMPVKRVEFPKPKKVKE